MRLQMRCNIIIFKKFQDFVRVERSLRSMGIQFYMFLPFTLFQVDWM